MQRIRSSVRPAVTYTLTAVQSGLAILWAMGIVDTDTAKDAFAALGPFTMMVVTFWFKDRTEVHRNE